MGSKIKISKYGENPLFDGIALLLFFVSFFNSYLCIGYYIFLILYSCTGTSSSVKSLILSSIRGIVNPAFASASPTYLKWALLFFAFVNIVIRNHLCDDDKKILKKVLIFMAVFCIIVAVSSLFLGSYPVISLFKILSFCVGFISIVLGVANSKNETDWGNYLFFVFTLLFIISAVLIPFNRFRTINTSFQGVFNHPNMFGICCSIYLALVYYAKSMTNRRLLRFVIVAIVLIMCFLCRSRTGMFATLIVIASYWIFEERNSGRKVIVLVLLGMAIIFVILLSSNILSQLNNYIYKGYDTLLYSRQSQFERFKIKYESNCLFGSGFMTPYYAGVKDYSFSFNAVVEPGNILFGVLGDSGIVGLVLFVAFIISIYVSQKKQKYLFFAAITINLGEMVFFSVNNMSILIYLLLAIYLFSPDKDSVFTET